MVRFLDAKGCGWSRLRPRWGWAWLVFAFLGIGQALAAPTFEASLERDTISMGESVTLTLAFQDCTPAGEPALPPLPGLSVTGTGYSKQSTFNGREIVSVLAFTYNLQPAKEGDYTLPAIKAKLNNGQQLATKPVTLKVVKGAVPPDGTPETAFVKIIVPKNQLYVGETLPIEIHCYCQNARDIQMPQLTGEGFTAGTVNGPLQPVRRVQLGLAVYNQVIFRTTLTPLKTGTLALGPATWGVTLLSGLDIWGNYAQALPTTLTSDTPAVQVLPLPTNNVPPGFKGAIGSFSLALFEATPTNLTAGDPITVKIRITGRGAFDPITLPQDQLEWAGFKVYPPTIKLESNDPLQMEGAKYFEQVVMPQSSAVKELPAFAFSFFDPSQRRYRTLGHPAVPVTVLPASAPPQPTIVSTAAPSADTPPPTQEIVHIKTSLGTVTAADESLIQQPGFLALQAVAPLAWIGVLLWRRRKENLAKNPRLLRQREVTRTVREGLKKLSELGRSNQTEEFYALVFHLLQEQLGERLDLPASAITEAVLEDLEPDGLSAETLASLRELFQICNLYRYAPQKSGQELASLLQKVEAALKSLRRAQPQRRSLKAAGCLLLLLAAATARAESPSAAFDSANKLYEQRHFPEAAAAYQTLINSGTASAALYFNLGNAWFKAGQNGRAILAYRQAELLSPRDPDVQANLQFVRNQVGNQPRPAARLLARWVGKLTLNEWTLATSCAWALFFAMLLARQWVSKEKFSLRGITLTLALLCAVLIVSLGLSLQSRRSESVVVTVPEAVVRRGPFVESQSFVTLRDGTELSVLGRKDDWLEISDSTKHTGWLLQKEVGLIR